MKIKNRELQGIVDALFSISNHTSDIKCRWELAKKSKAFVEANDMLSLQINRIIEEEGKLNDNKEKELSTDNKHYHELLNCEIDVNVTFAIEELEPYMPTMQELMKLQPIIMESDMQ